MYVCDNVTHFLYIKIKQNIYFSWSIWNVIYNQTFFPNIQVLGSQEFQLCFKLSTQMLLLRLVLYITHLFTMIRNWLLFVLSYAEYAKLDRRDVNTQNKNKKTNFVNIYIFRILLNTFQYRRNGNLNLPAIYALTVIVPANSLFHKLYFRRNLTMINSDLCLLR